VRTLVSLLNRIKVAISGELVTDKGSMPTTAGAQLPDSIVYPDARLDDLAIQLRRLRTELPWPRCRWPSSAKRPGAGLIHHSDRGVNMPRMTIVRR